MLSLITWVRERAHRTCTALITAQHDAVVAGAQAHHHTRQELLWARADIARLEGELARARAETDQAWQAQREMVQTLAAALEGAPDTQDRIRHLGVRELVDRLFEVGAVRSGLEHLVACPHTAGGEHLEQAAHRLLHRAEERSRELRALAAGAVT